MLASLALGHAACSAGTPSAVTSAYCCYTCCQVRQSGHPAARGQRARSGIDHTPVRPRPQMRTIAGCVAPHLALLGRLLHCSCAPQRHDPERVQAGTCPASSGPGAGGGETPWVPLASIRPAWLRRAQDKERGPELYFAFRAWSGCSSSFSNNIFKTNLCAAGWTQDRKRRHRRLQGGYGRTHDRSHWPACTKVPLGGSKEVCLAQNTSKIRPVHTHP